MGRTSKSYGCERVRLLENQLIEAMEENSRLISKNEQLDTENKALKGLLRTITIIADIDSVPLDDNNESNIDALGIPLDIPYNDYCEILKEIADSDIF